LDYLVLKFKYTTASCPAKANRPSLIDTKSFKEQVMDRNSGKTANLPRRAFLTGIGTGVLFFAPVKIVPAYAAPGTSKAPLRQPKSPGDHSFLARAFEMRQRAEQLGDQAYGAVVVRAGKIIGQSWSRVILDQDPTAHAEMAAIRDAAKRLGTRDLGGAVLYSTSRACPMCEAAAYWAGIEEMIHGSQARKAGRPKLCG
jgi:tRNA(Arg) A34 adenosine deaminase TadA